MKLRTLSKWDNLNQLSLAAAYAIYFDITLKLSFKNRYSIILSGGNSPKKLYEILASEPFKSNIPWSKILFFFGDERFVPPTNKESNYFMVKNTLFDSIDIPSQNIFKIQTEGIDPKESAKQYQNTIEHLSFDKNGCDLALCGLGDDGHTASLFPEHLSNFTTTLLVEYFFVRSVNMDRITLSIPFLNKSKKVFFLISGESKKNVVHQIIEKNDDSFPAAKVFGSDETWWFIDNNLT